MAKKRRKTSARKVSRRRKVARKPVRRKVTKRKTTKRKVTRRRVSKARKVATPAVAKPKPNADLAAMYLTIIIVGVAGIILLFANPTLTMQKVIGILLVILGLWGLMMKK
jgi:hypothetical protein